MMALMGAAVRIASQTSSNEMVVFMRNAFGLLALLPWLPSGGRALLATQQWRGHLLRACCGLAAMYCFFYALARLDLAQAVLLNFSSPLYIAPIAYFWLREALSWPLIAAALIGFLGVALVLQPTGGELSPAAAVGAFSGFLAALAMVSLRGVARSEPTRRTVFYFSAISTAVSAAPLLWAWQAPSVRVLGLMALAGFCATHGQLLLTHGYRLAPAARIGPYTYTTVIFATLIGWVLWREVPETTTLAGALFIVISGVLAMRGSRQVRPGDRGSERVAPVPTEELL